MWCHVNIVVVALVAVAAGSSDSNCQVSLQVQNTGPPKAIPAASTSGFVLAWQENDVIVLQWLDKACNSVGSNIKVVQSPLFYGDPSNGLQDVKELSDGSAAVAWLAGGNVWVSIVSPQGAGAPYQLTGPGSTRSDVQIAAAATSRAFAVSWTALAQDGVTWGMALRLFGADGQPDPAEISAPGQWRFSPYMPRAKWCGSTLWSLWINSTSQDTQGPFQWFIASADNPHPSPGPFPWNLQGGSPLVPALACNEGTSSTALWLEQGGEQIRWNYSAPEGAVARRLGRLDLRRRSFRAALGASPLVWPGFSLVADNGLAVMVSTDSSGTLKAELINYGSSQPVGYPPRDITSGAQNVVTSFVAADSGPPALIACWTSNTDLGSQKAAGVQCVRRNLDFLLEGDGLGLGAELAIVILLSMACLLCALKQCTRSDFTGRRIAIAMRLRQEEQQAQRDAESQARLRVVREQLTQISMTPTPAQPTSGNPDVCAICQNEIQVRVAFRPCGHTACCECVTKMVDLNQNCHICRGPIEAVQPVYI